MKKKISIFDIAKRSGYSTSTISRTISRPNSVSFKAREKINWHHSQGDRVIIVTASANIWLDSWCSRNGIELIATELEEMDGKVTGKLVNGNCFGIEKSIRVARLVNVNDYEEIYAYGDSRGDLELLDFANKPFYKPFRD